MSFQSDLLSTYFWCQMKKKKFFPESACLLPFPPCSPPDPVASESYLLSSSHVCPLFPSLLLQQWLRLPSPLTRIITNNSWLTSCRLHFLLRTIPRRVALEYKLLAWPGCPIRIVSD